MSDPRDPQPPLDDPEERPMPRHLVGWLDGMTYVPRPVVPVLPAATPAERAEDLQYQKQHRGRRRGGGEP